ncbi:MAG: leucyl aminopeptidase [Thermoplasmata archaeon]|nr:leucyl aminopeptidase [Thermoplasmata archaeon]
MKFALDRREATLGSVDASVVGVFERGEKPEPIPRGLAREDSVSKGLIGAAWERREIKGRRREITVIHRPDGKGRVLVVGLGPVAGFTADGVRRAAAEVVRNLKGKGVRTVGFRLSSFVSESVPSDAAVKAIVDGAALGAYEFLRYRTTTEGNVEDVTIHLGDDHAREEAALKRAVDTQTHIVDATLWTRDIANVPADTATPEWLAEQAKVLAKEYSLKITVFDEKKLAEMHCGGLLGVGSGSSHPPRMIVLEYSGGARSGKTVAIVGKGITFDSGGISIKPALNMSYMKFDKSGACAVLGAMRAAATLKVPPRVIGVLACAENLPGGRSYRPGDVLRTYNGKTIEVTNTDAEGRVVLSDALGYVVDHYHPDEVIDIATLTGACVVALGDDTAGVVGNDEKLVQGLLDASAATGEPLWRMPITDYHRELVKSDVADVRNSTEISVGGVLTGAAFLEAFVARTPWAHIDIAGPAWTTPMTRKYQPAYMNIGATAFGVRLFAKYLSESAR